MAESVSELRDELLKLTGGAVDIQIDEDTFKSTYQIMKELSEVWGSLTDISKANILEMVGGKRNANVVAALLENFQIAEDVFRTSQESAGSAMRENEKYVQSIAGRIEQFKAAFQSLSGTVVNSDILKFIVSLGTGIVSVIDIVVEKFGLLSAAIGAIAGIKRVSGIKVVQDGLSKLQSSIKDAGGAANWFKTVLGGMMKGAPNKAIGELTSVFGSFGLTASVVITTIFAIAAAYKYASGEAERSVEAHKKLVDEFEQASDNAENLNIKLKSQLERLRELNRIEAKTPANENEIAELEKSIELLEIQAELEEQLAAFKKKEVADSAYKTLASGNFYGGNGLFDPSSGYRTMVAEAERYKNEISRIDQEIIEANKELVAIDPSSSDYDRQRRQVNDLTARKVTLTNEYAVLKKEITSLYSDMINNTDKMGPEQDALATRIEELLDIEDAIDVASTSVEDLGKKFAMSASSIAEETGNVQERISSLSSALSSLNDGSLDIGGVIELLQKFPELVPYVDLATDGFGNLGNGLRRAIKQSPKDLIDELQRLKETNKYTEDQVKLIDDFADALRNMPDMAIADASGEFGVLADAINKATRAKNDLDKALESDEYDTGYERRVSAFAELAEVFESGEIGSKAYAAYQKYYGQIGKTAEEFKAWADENSKFFTEGAEGLELFLDKVDELDGVGGVLDGIASYDKDTGLFEYDINRLDEFAEKLGWTEEMVQDMLGKFRMFSEGYSARTTEETFNELINNGAIQKLGDIYVTTFDRVGQALGITNDEAKTLLSQISQMTSENIVASAFAEINAELRDMSQGGNVDLAIRPKIDTSELLRAGWTEDIVGEADNLATVFTSTFTDKAGTTAINFTPIQVDANGNYVGVLSPDEFSAYCEEVVNGVRSDDLNLQIGAKFNGDNALAEAEAAAARIHELHDIIAKNSEFTIIGEDELVITQSIIDGMYSALDSVEDVNQAIKELSGFEGVTFDADIKLKDGSTVADLLAQSASGEKQNTVTVDISLTEDVTTQITVAEEELVRLCGEDWSVILSADNEDLVEKEEAVEKLLNGLVGKPYSITINGHTQNAISAMNTVLALKEKVARPVTVDIVTRTITHASASTYAPGNGQSYAAKARGTRNFEGGVALLGDEDPLGNSPKPELVISKDRAYLAGTNGPELMELDKGDIILPYSKTKEVIDGEKDVRGSFERFYVGNRFDQIIVTTGGGSKKPSYTTGNTSNKYNGSSGTGNKRPSSGSSGGGGSSSSGSSCSSSDKDKDEKKESEFERRYKEHQHLLKMEKEKYADYIKWLEKAYKDAYEKGEIELDDYRKYAEEVFEGQKEIFKDSLNDIEKQIEILERGEGNDNKIINLYLDMIKQIEKEIQAAKDRGLNENDDWVQDLQGQLNDYQDAIKDIQDEIKENAEDSVKDLVDYRIKMLKQELQDQRDALNDKLSVLRDFYNKQKDMLQDSYDEEKKLEERNEKRKKKEDIEAELAQLQFDDSAWAEKRRLELQEQLAAADKELQDFEKSNALEDAKDLLDKMYEKQEEQINKEIEAIEAKLNDPKMLYNQALKDIQNNTQNLFLEMVKYNDKHGSGNSEDVLNMWNESKDSLDRFLTVFGKAYKDIIMVSPPSGGYARGTRHATRGVHRVDELGAEWLFQSGDGSRYRVFSGGEKVLNAAGSDFLYNFAMSRGENMPDLRPDVGGSQKVSKIMRDNRGVTIRGGDVIINGNANERTVSEIRRAQRENVDHILKEFTKLNK